MLGVPDGTEITVQPLDEDRLGYYSAASRQIVLSRSVLESGSAQVLGIRKTVFEK